MAPKKPVTKPAAKPVAAKPTPLAGIGQYNTVDPTFTGTKTYTATALQAGAMNAAPGQTAQQYLDSRGGVNAAGYYGDSWNANLNLTDAEYFAAVKGKVGAEQGEAINKAQQAKQSAYYASTGTGYRGSDGQFYADVNAASAAGAAVPGSGGSPTGGNLGNQTPGDITNERRDAFAAIRKTLLTYGFTESEMAEIDKYVSSTLINPRIGAEQALIDMRGRAAYKARFAGNEARVKAGLNAYSEADYLRQEDSYAQYLKAGGVESLGNRALYSKLIGGAVAPDEVGKRINLAVARVQNSDPEIKRQLQKFYPSITDKDMVGYFLSPETALPELQKKTTAAEIGAVAFNQGLNRSLAADDIETYRKSAEDLAAYGIDRAAAMEGYANIATVLPTSQKLSSIYKESNINYTQQTAESEFLKSNVDAAEKRRQLKALETAAFSGSSGTSKVSFASQARGAGQI